MKVATTQALSLEALKNAVEAERDTAMAQKKTTKAKNMELEVVTFIEINKLKTDLSYVNKEIKRLKEKKKKLEELVGAKKKAINEYKSSEQFMDDLANEYWEFSSKDSKIARRG